VDHLDILVNNGGMLQRADTVDVKLEEWDYVSHSSHTKNNQLILGNERQLEFLVRNLPGGWPTFHTQKSRKYHKHRFAKLLYRRFSGGLVLRGQGSSRYCYESPIQRMERTQHPSQRRSSRQYRYRHVSTGREAQRNR
jgi:hypothetical protein